MSFIPYFFKSPPQQITIAISGNNYTNTTPVTSVNTSYSAISINGYVTAVNQGFGLLRLTNATTITAARQLSQLDIPALDNVTIYGYLYEFLQNFLRQPVTYIEQTALASPQPHGLTLGPRAFGLCSGYSASSDPTGISETGFAYIDSTNYFFQPGTHTGIFIVDPV